MDYKFTKELKDSWLTALKSGKYVQGTGQLRNDYLNRYCCLGVLCEIHPDLEIDEEGIQIKNTNLNICYEPITSMLGSEMLATIYSKNDSTYNHDKPDYSNVIPLIESLPTID